MARKQLKDSAGVGFYPYTDFDAVVDGEEVEDEEIAEE